MSALGWRHLTPGDKETILRGIDDGVAYGGPFHVEIYPADRCNIDCFFCSTASLRGTDEIPMPRLEELLAELREAGTRSIRLAGGGEPLFHRRTKDFLRAVAASGLPIENVTTNGVLLGAEIAGLLAATCDQVTVSLNTADEATYAAMMQTSPGNFQRVVDNLRGLLAARRGRRGLDARRPLVNLQFLVWKGNYTTIPAMYALAREIGVDSIVFNGLAFLKPDERMTAAETAEMMALYEQVVRIDGYERIAAIDSFEQDIGPRVRAMNARIAAERPPTARWRRAARLLKRADLTPWEKIGRLLDRAAAARATGHGAAFAERCLIGWHSMVVRTGGGVAPCCILQGKELGNVYRQSVREVWYGDAYQQFRRELARIMRQGSGWRHDGQGDRTVEPLCGPGGSCPMISSPYGEDLSFRRSFQATLDRLAEDPSR